MSMMPQAREHNIVVQRLNDETLIYDLKIDKAYCLNETSALVWSLCDGTNSVAEIAKSISQKLDKKVSDEFVWLALDQFKADDLLENNDEFAVDFNGLSRRQMIKRVGLASMVMLPVISSLVAPTAAQGASLLPLFAGCSSNAQCASNFCTNSPARCCVPGTAGIRGASVCCDGTTANCNLQCCSNTGTISAFPGPACAPAGGFIIACPNS